MIKTFFIFLLCCVFCAIQAQNLFSNPGFELGLSNWDAFYSRPPGTGHVEITKTVVNSGTQAALIVHQGKEDWSFKHNGSIDTKPGEIFEFSAYCLVVRPGDWSQLSFVLLDALGNSIDWGYSPVSIISIAGKYEKFSTRIIVPAGVVKIWPRFIGGGDCNIYVDDVEVRLTGAMEPDKDYSLKNSSFDIGIMSPSFSMKILNKTNGKKYTVNPSNIFQVKSVDSLEGAFVFSCNYVAENIDLIVKISIIKDGLKFEIIPNSNSLFNNSLPFPGSITTNPGEYIVVPRGTGMLFPVEETFPFNLFSLYGWKSTMSFVGVTDLTSGYLCISENPWDTQFQFERPNGINFSAPKLVHMPSKKALAYKRTFYLNFFENGGYLEMARKYKEYAASAGYIKTFEKKIQENANIEKLIGAIDFWLPDNRYLKAQFIDSLYFSGLDKAIYTINGSWYTYLNIDGMADSINSRKMLSSRYDIYTDVFPQSPLQLPWYRTEGYPEDVIIDSDNSLHKGWLAYLDDGTPLQGYYACSSTHPAYAKKYLPIDLSKYHYNCRFVDVECASDLFECYSTVHPVTRKEDAANRMSLLSIIKNDYKLVTGSEEAREWSFPIVDFGEGTMSIVPPENSGYDWSTPVVDPGKNFIDYSMNPAKRIPLHGLVYHDVHVPTWYTGDGVSKVPAYWDTKDLFNILYATMPLFMPPTTAYWDKNKERFIISANLVSSVFRSCGYSAMTDHSFLSQDWKVQKTHFENGWDVVANFGLSDYNYNNYVLPSMGFYASNGVDYVYRIKTKDGGIAAAAKLSDRLFIAPNNTIFEADGIKSSGTLLLQKLAGNLNMAFIGNQNYIDLNPSMIPWPVKNITVKSRYNPKVITPVALGNGWIRINKADNEIFYIINGDFATSVQNHTETTGFNYSLEQNYPNPFNMSTTISYSLNRESKIRLSIFDILGREVAVLEDSVEKGGKHSLVWSGQDYNGKTVASGVYYLRLVSEEYSKTIKLNLLK